MGLNNEYAQTISRPWLAFDIETVPILEAKDYIDPPDLSGIEAPSNYKKPEVIADYIAREQVRLTEKHERDCAERSALDWNLGRIAAIGYQIEGAAHPRVLRCENYAQEAMAIAELVGAMAARRPIIGFGIRSFDLPFVFQRMRYLSMRPPVLSLARFSNPDLLDLFDLLTFSDTQTTKIMPHKLGAFARRFGIEHDDSVAGKDIPALVAAGEWGQVEAHVSADVRTTVALARRLLHLPAEQDIEAVA